MAICPIIAHFITSHTHFMYDMVCEFVCSKDVQKQLAQTSLRLKIETFIDISTKSYIKLTHSFYEITQWHFSTIQTSF